MNDYAKHLTLLANWKRLLLATTTFFLATAVISLSFRVAVAQAEVFITTYTGAACFEQHPSSGSLPTDPALRRTYQGAVHNTKDVPIDVVCPGLTRYVQFDDESGGNISGYFFSTAWNVKVFDRHARPGNNVSCKIVDCPPRSISCNDSRPFSSSDGIGRKTLSSRLDSVPPGCGFYQNNTFLKCTIPGTEDALGETAIHSHQTFQFGRGTCLEGITIQIKDTKAPLFVSTEGSIESIMETLADLDEKFIEELEDSFYNEEIDKIWANKKMDEIDEYLRADPQVASNFRVECRSTMCKLTISPRDDESFHPSILLEKTGASPLTGGSVFVNPDKGKSFIAYLGLTGKEQEFSKTVQELVNNVYR